MAKDRLKSPRVRLFVALDLPEEIRDRLGAWGRKALADPALRPVPTENLHITLAFLGYRPEKDVERIGEAMAECASPAPLIELLDPVPRPPRGRPRIFALPAISPGAEALQAALQKRLVAERLYEPEKRPFWPHLTLARVRPEERGSRRPAKVEMPPASLPAELKKPHFSGRLALYRSELKPSGARYVPLAQIELPGAGRQ